ncbi:ABC transporter permease [Devosia sp.]|uniref:ABC transporter permease n=1 Tax=Devosia sp. TaxID=1871048 RepID=UPI002F144E1D
MSKSRLVAGLRGSMPFLVSLAFLAAAWEIAGRTTDLITLPPLSDVLAALARLWAQGVITAPLLDSTLALATGVGISLGVGAAIGVAMGLWRPIDIALGPFVKAGLSAPLIAFVPVFLMLFGIGSTTRIATVIAFSVFIVIANAATAIRAVDKSLVEMGHSFGASPWRAFWDIRVPAGAPYFMAGLRLGVARGVKGLINGEVLIAIIGLGGLVKKYGTVFSMDQLYAVIIVIVAYAALAVGAVSWLGRRVIRDAPDGP